MILILIFLYYSIEDQLVNKNIKTIKKDTLLIKIGENITSTSTPIMQLCWGFLEIFTYPFYPHVSPH